MLRRYFIDALAYLALGFTLGLILCFGAKSAGAQELRLPRDALRYKADFIRNVRVVWGMSAPVAVLAAQIEQESSWNAEARSPFAAGLAQFTPGTASWLSGIHSRELGPAQPFNPAWAMRALAQYDQDLYRSQSGQTACDRWGFALSAYNGGQAWVQRDRAAAKRGGAKDNIYWGSVELYNAGRAPQYFKENRDYPRSILLKRQPAYFDWGGSIQCG
jgi:hypothetical protein